MKRPFLIPILAAASLSGCVVGPNFTPPSPGTPTAWNDPAAGPTPPGPAAAITTLADPRPDWWTGFDDPELTSLIDRATQGNLDLKIAVQRIAEARSGEVTAAAAGLPSLTGKATYTYQQSSLDALLGQIGSSFPQFKPTKPAPAFGLYEGALDASWEIDLFGKVRRSVEASKAGTEAALGDGADSLVSLQAEVAQNYAQLRAAQANLAAAKADIATERDLLALTKDRTAHGLTTGLDVKNAEAQLAASQAQAPQYEQQIATYMNGLAVLLGEAPGALDAELAPVRPIPSLAAASAPIGLPASLARRRPDIRAAEARLHQQTANVGVAVAQLYPDITLTGEIGQQSGQIKNFFKSYDNIFSLAPSISLPIFEGGKLKAGIAQAKAERVEAELTYRKTVLGALQDVENALAAYRTDASKLESLKTEGDADQAAVDIAQDRYKHGLSTYLDVLTPQNTLIQAQEQLVQAQLSVSNDLVTLYKALGGGWQAAADARQASETRTNAGAESPQRGDMNK